MVGALTARPHFFSPVVLSCQFCLYLSDKSEILTFLLNQDKIFTKEPHRIEGVRPKGSLILSFHRLQAQLFRYYVLE